MPSCINVLGRGSKLTTLLVTVGFPTKKLDEAQAREKSKKRPSATCLSCSGHRIEHLSSCETEIVIVFLRLYLVLET